MSTILNERQFHSPLICYGPNKEGIELALKEFIKGVLSLDHSDAAARLTSGNHPDIVELAPEGKGQLYSMQTIVRFLQEVHLPPYESHYKVYFFHDAEKMLPVHANALLKTLEEKPDFTVIILQTEAVKDLLETLASRCKKIHFADKGEPFKKNRYQGEMTLALQLAWDGKYNESVKILAKIDGAIGEGESEAAFEEIIEHFLGFYKERHLDPTLHLKTPALETVFAMTETARLALERFVRFKNILEYLVFQPLA